MIDVFTYFTLWCGLYGALLVFNRKCSAEWNSRVMALIHAVVVARNVEFCVFTTNLHDFGLTNTACENMIVAISAGYFVLDTTWCICMRTENLTMMLHHFLSLISLLGVRYLDYSAKEVLIMLWCAEITNPFLQFRWFLRENNLHTKLYSKINEFVFVVLFLFMRLFVSSYLLYRVWNSALVTLHILTGGAVFHVINLLFVYQVFGLIHKRVYGKASLKDE